MLLMALRLTGSFDSGNKPDTRGTAYVVYEDIFDAKNACEHLAGFNVMGRYIVVLYHQPQKLQKKLEEKKALTSGTWLTIFTFVQII